MIIWPIFSRREVWAGEEDVKMKKRKRRREGRGQVFML
jgi:hypothetical protein